jgi:hypothetical protein
LQHAKLCNARHRRLFLPHGARVKQIKAHIKNRNASPETGTGQCLNWFRIDLLTVPGIEKFDTEYTDDIPPASLISGTGEIRHFSYNMNKYPVVVSAAKGCRQMANGKVCYGEVACEDCRLSNGCCGTCEKCWH